MSIFGSAPEKFGGEREGNHPGYGRPENCSYLWSEIVESHGDGNQKHKRGGDWLRHSPRVNVVLHYFHAARNGSADAIQRHARHGAKKNREGGNHLRLETQTIVKQPNCGDDNDSRNRGLRDPKNYGDAKECPAACAVPDGLRSRDECDDRIIETKNTDLADDVGGRPGNGEYAERRRPEHPRDEKCEDAAEIRRQHRDGVQEGAAF